MKAKLFTIAYSTINGRELWRAEAPAKMIEAYHKTEGSPAASSVATDGKTIVSYFGSCGIFAYDLTGKELWKYDLPMAKTAADFGTGVSPILVDGLVILQRDEMNEPQIIAFDATTGRPKWDTKRPPATSYCTPAVWNTEKGKQIVCGGYGRMVGYDLQTGEEQWSVAGMPSATCTTPVVGDGMLYFSGWSPGDVEDSEFKFPQFDDLLKSGDANQDGKVSREESEKTFLKGFFDSNDTNKDGQLTRDEWDAIIKYMSAGKNSVFAVKAGGHGDITKTHVAWKKTKGMPYVPSAILVDGQYFMVKDGGLCTSYDAKTGKEIYVQKRAVANGRYYASPVSANGNIYVVSLDEGKFTVLKAGTDSPEVVAEIPNSTKNQRHTSNRRRHHLCPYRKSPLGFRREAGNRTRQSIAAIRPRQVPLTCVFARQWIWCSAFGFESLAALIGRQMGMKNLLLRNRLRFRLRISFPNTIPGATEMRISSKVTSSVSSKIISLYVGLDYHETSIRVCVMDREGVVLANRNVRNSVLEVRELIRSYDGVVDGVAIEACCGSADFAAQLIEVTEWPVRMAHPTAVNRLKNGPNKTDEGDAWHLANLLRVGYLPEVWLADEATRQLRRLVRFRQGLVDQKKDIKLRIGALLREERIENRSESNTWTKPWMAWLMTVELGEHSRWVLDRELERLEQVEKELSAVLQRMERATQDDAVVAKLKEQPGIGVITAVTMRAVIGRFDRFRSGKQLACYCGVTPCNASSGKRQSDAGLIQSGNDILRPMLIQLAKRLPRHEPRWRDFHLHLRLRKGANVASAAIANRWLRRLYHEMVSKPQIAS